MKRDRKKGAGPEYEDLLYDETPSVVVYYPSKGENPDAPEPTRKRDRSTAGSTFPSVSRPAALQ